MVAKSRKQPQPGADSEGFELPGRSFWSGTLSFGLVTVPVSLYSAQRSAHSSLRMLAPDGTPLVRRYFCPADEAPVAPEHIVHGYELSADEYVTVTDEELDALAPEKSHDIELRQFVDASAIPPAMFEHAYVLGPRREGVRAYRLLATAMEQSGKAGVATFVMHGKEYLVAIFASRGLLRAETLRFADELRGPADLGLPSIEQVDAKHARVMRQAIKRKSRRKFDPDELEEGYWARVKALAERKQARGRDVIEIETPEPEQRGADVIDLFEALKKSLSGAKPTPHGKASGESRSTARRRVHKTARSKGSRKASSRSRSSVA